MGAGQIGGIATLLDVDFNNAAGFVGRPAIGEEAQYVVHYLSHALLFCVGALIEPHVVLTPAACVAGERYKFDVIGGTHKFLEYTGTKRLVENVCIHTGYNHTKRWDSCSTDNLALLVVSKPFSIRHREKTAEFIINRVRYGMPQNVIQQSREEPKCAFYGFGSRRNGYLIPLLIELRRVEVRIMSNDHCGRMWNVDNKFLCLHQAPCRSDKFGSLCPDDMGTVIECDGSIYGMMVSQLVDRLCGIGFLDLTKYNKFITCAVDDSRDVMDHMSLMSFDFANFNRPTPVLVTPGPEHGLDSAEDVAEKVTTSLPLGF